MADAIVVTFENPYSPEATTILAHFSADLIARYGNDSIGVFKPRDVDVPGGAFVLARINGQVVGCGALRPLEHGVGEVKRMFVEPETRRQGISRRVLSMLETAATHFGYRCIRLETGDHSTESIALYEAAGYHRIPCFGEYVGEPSSICFEKKLRNEPERGKE
jgi:ribosomal protein S18 acetylase RimI-like enzyme